MNFGRLPRFWRNVISYGAVALVSAAIAFTLGASTNPDVNYSSSGTIVSTKDKLDVIQAVIKESYVGEYDQDKLINAAAQAMVMATGDQWSYYMTADEYKKYRLDTQNQYQGIGVTVKVDKAQDGFVIDRIEPDSGGEKAGLKPGDIITHIEGENIAALSHEQARDRIRGKEGTSVELTILRGKESQVMVVSRGPVAVRVAIPDMLENDIGFIQIVNFDDRCAKETKAAIEELQKKGAKALIFDVRGNPGGYKRELVELLDYLLPEGTLFSSESTDGEKSQDTSDAACLEIPMAVLVNKGTYSAAEYFAAALDEYDWAVTVGEATTGKGYFQTDIKLDDGSALHLSVGKYYTPKGVSLSEAGGITPKEEVTLSEEEAKLRQEGKMQLKDDPQIQAAVKALEKKLK